VRRVGPRLGEHNEEVLAEFGFDDERIRQLIDAGALR
jgi:formyl-CoA transferase